MILPILRLVLIYFLLVAGVVAVFNRDKLAPLLPGARDREAAAETASAAAPAPLAEMPAIEPAPAGGQIEASDAAGQDATGETGDAGSGPVFPEPAELAAPVVTPAPGIAPEGAPLTPTPPDTSSDAQADPSVASAPAASAATADAPAQPARHGSPAPLGTPVATAPQAGATPAAPVAAPTGEIATETTPQIAPETAPAAPAELTAPTPAQATPSAEGTGDPAALADDIAAARQAYWSGDIEGARAGMNALAEAHPDNPEVAGELGNLAFALRDYPAAAEAWHRAGLLLIENGENARVMSFLPFLQSIAPDKAAELAARLQER